jgi:hypothetical protein
VERLRERPRTFSVSVALLVFRVTSIAENEDRWGRYSPDSLRGNLKDYVEDEAEAAEVRSVETVLISGLLQTATYLEALLRGWAPDIGDEVIAERRQLRQARLDDHDTPPHLHAILHEPALQLPIGGGAVMREQFDHLLARAELPNVTVQVIPSSVGAFPGIGPPTTWSTSTPARPERSSWRISGVGSTWRRRATSRRIR